MAESMKMGGKEGSYDPETDVWTAPTPAEIHLENGPSTDSHPMDRTLTSDIVYSAYKHAQDSGEQNFSPSFNDLMSSYMLGSNPTPERQRAVKDIYESNEAQKAAEVAAQRVRKSVSVIPPSEGYHNPLQDIQTGDLTPAHKPGTEPKDYLRELLQNPDIMSKGIEQASNFNFTGTFGGVSRNVAGFWRQAGADILDKFGATPEFIKRMTGLERGTKLGYWGEGPWKHEVDDSKAVASWDAMWQPTREANDSRSGTFAPKSWQPARLGDVLDHPELYAKYPKLRDVLVKPVTGESWKGAFNRFDNDIKINQDRVKTKEQLKSVLLHETQHWIQVREGWPSDVTDFYSPYWKSEVVEMLKNKMLTEGLHNDKGAYFSPAQLKQLPYDKLHLIAEHQFYKRMSSEVEARNTQARMNMTAEERRNSLAESTEDIPRTQQWISGYSTASGQDRLVQSKSDPLSDYKPYNPRKVDQHELDSLNNPDHKNDWIGYIQMMSEEKGLSTKEIAKQSKIPETELQAFINANHEAINTPEKVSETAIRVGGKTGKVYSHVYGHYDALQEALKAGENLKNVYEGEQGYVTNRGRFLSPDEAIDFHMRTNKVGGSGPAMKDYRSWKEFDKAREVHKEKEITKVQNNIDVGEVKLDDLKDNIVENIRDENPDLSESSATHMFHDMLKGGEYDMPGHITDDIQRYKEMHREKIVNSRLLEILRHKNFYYSADEVPESIRNSLSRHTDAEHKSYEEWTKIAEEQELYDSNGKPNPYSAMANASRGEFDYATGSWSKGGKKTSTISPHGTLEVYEHGFGAK